MNKKIVVTGGTRGIGRAIAEKFVDGGYDLAVCARSEKDLLQLRSEILNPKPSGPQKPTEDDTQIITQVCDVSKKDELKRFADTVLEKFGAVDVLINNAGVFFPGEVYREKDGTLETIMETNLYSAYHLSRWLVPEMIKKEQGHIFNMCSVASIQAYPNGGSYSISKFALLGLSKALREELKPFKIRVTAVVAGATHTDSWAGSGHPEERFIKTSDIAQLVWDINHLSAGSVVEELLIRPMAGDI